MGCMYLFELQFSLDRCLAVGLLDYKEDTYNGVLLSHKNEIIPFSPKWVDLETTMQVKKVRQISYITYMWNLKPVIKMNLFTKQRQTHRL